MASNRKEYLKSYYISNRDKCLARDKKWRENNKDLERKRKKLYRKNNVEKIRIYQHKWRKANPNRVKRYSINWDKANPQKRQLLNLRWRMRNSDKWAEYQHNYYLKNKKKRCEYSRQWCISHPSHAKNYMKKWICDNRSRINGYNKKWRQLNPGKFTAAKTLYRIRKIYSTPSWLTKEQYKQIESFYIEAHRLTKETGIKYSVDHIWPIRGKDFVGLHVPWNLRVISFSENCRKNNKTPTKQQLGNKTV